MGCEDGGLRLASVGSDGHLDYQPKLFPAVNGVAAPSLTSIHSVSIVNSTTSMLTSSTSHVTEKREKYLCAAGSKDGTVSTFYLL